MEDDVSSDNQSFAGPANNRDAPEHAEADDPDPAFVTSLPLPLQPTSAVLAEPMPNANLIRLIPHRMPTKEELVLFLLKHPNGMLPSVDIANSDGGDGGDGGDGIDGEAAAGTSGEDVEGVVDADVDTPLTRIRDLDVLFQSTEDPDPLVMMDIVFSESKINWVRVQYSQYGVQYFKLLDVKRP